MKIGIPRGLLYYRYIPLWKTFYEELGYEVVISPKTNKMILDLGIKSCVDEACLPIKIFHGHVEFIKNKVDFLFMPRVTSIFYKEFNCPKIIGVPEMVIHSIDNLPKIIQPIFNFYSKRSNNNKNKIIQEMIGPLEVEFKKARIAFRKGMNQLEIYNKNLYNGFLPEQAIHWRTVRNSLKRLNDKGSLLILSHPYNLYDEFINMNLIKKIKSYGFHVLTIDTMEKEKINIYASQLPKKMFWTFGREMIGAGLYAQQELNIDGVIYLSSFACGLDSFIADYIERNIRREGLLPYMLLTIDEQTGQAGIDTRIEAFIDMIERRKFNDGDFSSYGKFVYRN
ncbi:acyl-CoA dehydratase activase-related protein [Garciella nitratireducens]|uniref:Predicted nucleotide-binding protein, sugar kinase/HSP70/actin superfamily n=1 Tax=Garciella nitratireducens DSM 15102 TaxID=1121911 RepID=A0A1T4JS95_9FIRM|nr:acyl-CoA dehydratase activase-related protein [Garciella nitratireducens]SJZ33019.1 Predicted nucleotide-binding protein, sugar kinase/HSP70/actin superfamily [Garciella nitratireducens DSM 15102]